MFVAGIDAHATYSVIAIVSNTGSARGGTGPHQEIDHGLFEVYFGPIWLGRFVEPKRLIFDSLGRGQRRTGGTCKGRRTVT